MEDNYIKPIGETLQDKIQWLEKELFKEKEKNKQLTDEYMIQKHLINAEFLDDYIPKSKVEELIEELREKVKENNKTFEYGLNTYGEYYMNGLMKELKLNDYFDDRKNVNLNKFKYCPYCGNKIDWKELKNLGG